MQTKTPVKYEAVISLHLDEVSYGFEVLYMEDGEVVDRTIHADRDVAEGWKEQWEKKNV